MDIGLEYSTLPLTVGNPVVKYAEIYERYATPGSRPASTSSAPFQQRQEYPRAGRRSRTDRMRSRPARPPLAVPACLSTAPVLLRSG